MKVVSLLLFLASLCYSATIGLAGFELGSIAELLRSGDCIIESGTKRTGNYSAEKSGYGDCDVGFGSTQSELVGRWYVYFNGPHSGASALDGYIFRAKNGVSRIVDVRIRSYSGAADDKIYIDAGGSGTSTNAISRSQWVLVEIHLKTGTGSDGVIEVKVDGVVEISDTAATFTTDIDGVELSYDYTTSAEKTFNDDALFQSGSTWIGAGQIEALQADGDSSDSGEDEFQDQDAGSATYDDVSDTPPDTNTYAVESVQNDPDHRQLWTLAIHTIGLFDDSTPLDPEGVWTGDANAFDGDDATAATTNTGGTKDLNELQGDGVAIVARTEAIASVVLIAKIGSTSVSTTTHVEIFTDGRGESLGSVSINGNVTQTKRITLTVPAGGWSWAKVAALEAVCYATQGGVGTASVYIVQALVFAELAVDTINHVRIGLWTARGAGSGTEHRIRSKVSTPENSADLGLTTSYAYYIFDPATQPSNQSELDSYQAGVWRNDGGREYYAADQWVMVDRTPGAPPAGVAGRLLLLGVGP